MPEVKWLLEFFNCSFLVPSVLNQKKKKKTKQNSIPPPPPPTSTKEIPQDFKAFFGKLGRNERRAASSVVTWRGAGEPAIS